MKQSAIQRLRKWWPAFLFLAILIIGVILLCQRWNLNLASHPNPAQNYEDALQRIQAIQADEDYLNPLCKTQFLTHGKKTEHTIVFVHGYSTCPQQFLALGKRFYALGYNVLIIPLAHHGLKDRMTDEQSQIKAEEFAPYADKVVDIAQGLGKHITIGGISLGAAISGWVIQNRSDVDKAILISPVFSFKAIPEGLSTPFANFFILMPVSYDWWNDDLKEKTKPPYAYPRYTKHTLGEILRFGYSLQTQIEQSVPRGKAIIVVTNGNDASVDNQLTAQIVKIWQANGANISTYEFPKELQITHDMIDIDEPTAHVEITYPKLIELATQ